jgi:hypothetical protein
MEATRHLPVFSPPQLAASFGRSGVFLMVAPPPLTGPLFVGFYFYLVFCFFRLDLAVYLLHVQGLLMFYGFLV